MKTPMQQLVDELKFELHISTLPEEREYNSGLRAALVMAEGMLEKEKEVIENAYWDGGQDVPAVGSRCEDYYNKTFNNDQ